MQIVNLGMQATLQQGAPLLAINRINTSKQANLMVCCCHVVIKITQLQLTMKFMARWTLRGIRW